MNIDRRQFLGSSASVLGVLAAGGCNIVASNKVDTTKPSHRSDRKRTLRFAHMTDIHLNDERNAAKGFRAALTHIHDLDDPPELIVTGGDLIMDSLGTSVGRAHEQWDLFNTTLKQKVIPAEFRGRVFGTLDSLNSGLVPLSLVLGGALIDLLDKNIALLFLGIFIVYAMLATAFVLDRPIRSFYLPGCPAAVPEDGAPSI